MPVIAIILLGHYVFPTTETKEPDVGKRRINHGAKALLYYFLSMLLKNYSSAISSAKPYGWPFLDDSPGKILRHIFSSAVSPFASYAIEMPT